MKVLGTIQRIFAVCGIDSIKNRSKLFQVFNRLYTYLFAAVDTSGAILSFIYAVINKDNLDKFTAGALALGCYLYGTGIIYNTVWKKEEYRVLVDYLQKIVDERCAVPSREIYQNLEVRVTRYTRIFTTSATVPYTAIAGSALLVVLVAHLLGKYDKSLWFFTFEMYSVVELNTKTRLLIFFLYQYVAAITGLTFGVSILNLYLCICLYAFTLISDIQSLLESLNNERKSIEIRQQLIVIIEFHNTIGTLLNKFADFMSGYIFTTILSLIGALCVNLYQLQQYNEDLSMKMAMPLLEIVYILVTLFVFCYFGDRMTTSCFSIGDAAYCKSLWYNYSLDHQKCIFMIIIRSQMKFFLTGKGFVRCSMENFMAFVKASVTAYMVLRTV